VTGENSSCAKNSATFAERPPALQITYSVADRSISSRRAGTSPIKMCCASAGVAAFPFIVLAHIQQHRARPEFGGQLSDGCLGDRRSPLTPSISACTDRPRDNPCQLSTGIHSFHRFIHKCPGPAASVLLHVFALDSAAGLWITDRRNRFVIYSRTCPSANS
jgi:hypothetical protein